MKYILMTSVFLAMAGTAQAEILQGKTSFELTQVEAILNTGSRSTDPEQQMACEMQFAQTGADGDLMNGVLEVSYEINTSTNMLKASGVYNYAAGSQSAPLDNFFTLGISGVYAFMDTSASGVLFENYGVFRTVFELSLETEPLFAFMLVQGGDDFNCKLSTS
ncbi:MAG: hypothetical protein AAFR71_03925 [Pseudomonadota bacterium]